MPNTTASSQRRMVTATAFLAAPAFMLVYGMVRLLGGRHGPGPGWTVGHLAFLIALVLFGLVLLGLRRLADSERRSVRMVADVAAGAGFLGLVAMIIQIGVDLVVGLAAADHAEMGRMFDEFQAWPGVTPAIYTIVPQLLFAGLIVLTVLAAVTRRATPLMPVLTVIGTALAAADLNLLPAAALCFGAALTPTALTLVREADRISATRPHGTVRT